MKMSKKHMIRLISIESLICKWQNIAIYNSTNEAVGTYFKLEI